MKQQLNIASALRPDGRTSIRVQYALTAESQNEIIETISLAVFLANNDWTILAAQEAALSEALRQLQSELADVRAAMKSSAPVQPPPTTP